ncbi:MAG: response regulator transcription factor [Planktomarina sp.]
MKKSILIIEDDPQIRNVVQVACEVHGYDCDVAGDGAEGLKKAQSGRFDLILLDIGLPQMDGLAVCRKLRQTDQTSIIFLTARQDEVDRVLGLEMGGDDYVAKPFSPRELMARVGAVLRRAQVQPQSKGLRVGTLVIDPSQHLASFDNMPLDLTAREMTILSTLAARPTQVFPRPDLVDQVYGVGVVVSDRTLDSHLRNLRAKLAAVGCSDGIDTLHGVGVRMGACLGGA